MIILNKKKYISISALPSAFFLSYIGFFCTICVYSQSDLKKKSFTYNTVGYASYYSNKFAGKKTASGDIYDPKKFTASHRTLPFGTKVKVENLSNGKSVVVTINDRGPLKKERIIDLSFSAAKALGIEKKGIAKVKIEILK
jgi:rare lipoprotein A